MPRITNILTCALGVFATFSILASVSQSTAEAQRYASKQRSNVAVGHYARARAMMVEALKEFEQGRRLARPDLLVDSEDFRLRLVSLTEELNRLVDPKPRVTRQGAVFRANPRMVRRESDALPPVPGGPQDSNVYGEAQRQQELEHARARMYENSPPKEAAETETVEEEAPEEEVVVQVENEPNHEPEAAAVEAPTEEPAPEQEAAHQQEPEADAIDAEEHEDLEDEVAAESESPDEKYSEAGKEVSKDQQIANSIEQAIQERLKNLEADTEAQDEVEDEATIER